METSVNGYVIRVLYMVVNIEKGNQNVFTAYHGRYEFTMANGQHATILTPMLICVNTGQFKIDKGNPDNMTTYRKVIL